MNKKKIFGSIAVLAIAAMAAFNVNVNTQENGLSDVSLENVEALAQEIAGFVCETPPWVLICARFNSGETEYGYKRDIIAY